MKRIALIALLASLAVGCGSASTSSSIYTRAATKQCLQKLGLQQFPSLGDDFVASTASGGALRVGIGDNAVTILFGQNADEGGNLADAYRRFHAKNVGVEDVLRTQGNAVMLWQMHPSADDEAKADGCLK